MPPPETDTINKAFDAMSLAFIAALTENAADAFIAGQVAATHTLKLPLSFNLISSRAVRATTQYRQTLERFGGTDVTTITESGKVIREFKPWLKDAIAGDKEQVGKIIADAVRDGTPLKQVEKALDDVFSMREHNAKLTAFQETKALYNQGTFERFNEEGIQKGTFIHMDPQESPRPEHQELNGQVFDLDDTIWYELELPNCHCYCEPVIP